MQTPFSPNADLSAGDSLADLAERYADGALPAAERTTFEERLRHDNAARLALAAHTQLIGDLRAVARAELKAHLSRLDPELAVHAPLLVPTSSLGGQAPLVARRGGQAPAPASLAGRRYSPFLSAAAALLLLLGAWVALRGPDRQLLVTHYGLADPGLPVLMSAPRGETTADGVRPRSLLNEAMNAYQLHHYQQALAVWARIPTGAIGADTLAYYRGLFLLRAHRPTEAARELARVRADAHSAFQGQARYQEALALWADGHTSAARHQFTLLAAQTNHPLAPAARAVLPHVR